MELLLGSCPGAACGGHLRLLQWIRERGLSLDYEQPAAAAATSGQVYV